MYNMGLLGSSTSPPELTSHCLGSLLYLFSSFQNWIWCISYWFGRTESLDHAMQTLCQRLSNHSICSKYIWKVLAKMRNDVSIKLKFLEENKVSVFSTFWDFFVSVNSVIIESTLEPPGDRGTDPPVQLKVCVYRTTWLPESRVPLRLQPAFADLSPLMGQAVL